MSNKETQEKIDKFMEEMKKLLKMPALNLQTPIKEILSTGKFDSMDRSEIVMQIEDHFGVDIWGHLNDGQISLVSFSNFQFILDFALDKKEKAAT